MPQKYIFRPNFPLIGKLMCTSCFLFDELGHLVVFHPEDNPEMDAYRSSFVKNNNPLSEQCVFLNRNAAF